MTPSPVHYIPILTTVFALGFAVVLFRRLRERGGQHLLWWGLGMLTYAAGTITESSTTLLGWHEPVFRLWYITGALLGGAPLAQGTVYLMLPRRTANRLTLILVATVLAGAVCVWLSPINQELVEPYRLSGKVLEWRWVRFISPFINLYALVFLMGGAILSAVRYARKRETRYRALANVFIAVGALLPGVGGTFTRLGHVEVLYVTEFLGLCCIAIGYRLSVGPALPHAGLVSRPAPAPQT
ncbi:MAG TPA: hypothetical protein VEI47_00270 [Gemmatimonadales bacterium]|jgi:hypothetical protein|nr:hypothetical protein [Gemmatimonadales bacterium]